MANQLNHLAFIMDGNNRWSKKNSINIYDAYHAGAKNLIKQSIYLFNATELKYISAFALSTDNLKRSKFILTNIKNVLIELLNNFDSYDLNFDLLFLGDFSFLEKQTIEKIQLINNKVNFKKKLIIYLNYGGREDIQSAAKNNLNSKDNKNFRFSLITKDLPDPDLLIRTGGYQRLSNFLLYQLAFTELFFLKKLWPDLKKNDLNKILSKYKNIERKFGK